MKNIVYWDYDVHRIERVRSCIGTAYSLHIAPSVEEMRRRILLQSPAAAILGWKGELGEGFMDRLLPRDLHADFPTVVLSDSERWPCGGRNRRLHPLPPARHHLVAEVLADILDEDAHAEKDPIIFIGESKEMKAVAAALRRYADSPCPVLILGETGTGKELAANALHRLSRRKDGPFVALNCAALPEGLVESELFGVERGAYTDAVPRKGALSRAEGGTLFLDEIGAMAMAAQPKLLRALEHGVYWKLGANAPDSSRFRLVSATCEEILAPSSGRLIRSDLLFRIADLIIHIPPLRRRKEDIVPLAEHFCHAAGKGLCELSDPAVSRLLDYPWPGNVRELRSVINRACADVSHGRIEAEDLVFISFFSGSGTRTAPQPS